MEYKEVIDKLNGLDLKLYPADEVESLFKKIGNIGVVITTLGPGKKVIRARTNKSFCERFKTKSSLSYPPKPSKYYGRASSPGNVMFYGSIVPEILGESEPDTARATALYEVSDLAKDRSSIGLQKVTFSVWEVIKNIELVSLIHFEEFERPTKISIELQKQYKIFIEKYPDLQMKSDAYTKFLSKEFAKSDIEGDFDYFLSASFTEMLIRNGVHGVLYPSVPLAGQGVNVAIRPEIVDSNMILRGAVECMLYKNKLQAVIGNDKEAKILEDEKLKYKKVNKENLLTRKEGRKKVGMNYRNFLKCYSENIF